MVFSKPRYPRYAIDLSHPAIRYAIAAAITVSGRYAATFPNNGPCLVSSILAFCFAQNFWLKWPVLRHTQFHIKCWLPSLV